MAKKMKNAPRIKVPIDRQTPDQTFAPRAQPPVTRLPPATAKPKKQKPEEADA